MHLAVLADIHANLPAPETVLADAEQHHVDEYLLNWRLANWQMAIEWATDLHR